MEQPPIPEPPGEESSSVTTATALATGPPPPPGPPSLPDAPEHRKRPQAIMLAVAAVVAAVLGGRASLLNSEASDMRSKAVREQVKRAAATIEQIQYNYVTQGPMAIRTAASELREEEFRAAAGKAAGPLRDRLLLEADVENSVGTTLLGSLETTGAGADKFRTESGGFDLAAALADNFAEYPDLLALDPDRTHARAEEMSRQAGLQVGTTFPVSLAFLAGAFAQGFPRRRRALLAAGWAFVSLAVVAFAVVEVTL